MDSFNKPNRTESNKGEKYHAEFAEWAVSMCLSNPGYQRWLKRIKVAKNFYKGDQWTMEEDVETFLKDESNNTRNRIKAVINQIRPIIEQYRGNGSILKINGTAKSTSKLSINRREIALSKKIFQTELANEFPALGEVMRRKDKTIKDSVDETTITFNNLYVDAYISQVNYLLRYGAELNELAKTQITNALHLAMTGLCVIENYTHGGHVRSRVVKPEDIIYDMDAEMPDLSDGSYIGTGRKMDVSYILERYQIDPAIASDLEKFVNSFGSSFGESNVGAGIRSTNRPIVYNIYWKDSGREEYGYVADPYGYPFCTRINYTYPGEESPRYTDEDLLDPPKTPKNELLFKNGSKKRKAYFDEVRFCTFIPSAYMEKAQGSKSQSEKCGTLVLDFGLLEYQETDVFDDSNAKFPTKCQTWGYIDGEIFAPIDDAISPQRLINRVVSVFEAQINQSGGSGAVIDESTIDPNGRDIDYDMKEGNAVRIDTRGKGVNNSIGYYDNTPKAGTYNLLSIVPTMKGFTQESTGINEALKGESTGSDQLVGVTKSQIQRGSLMQEPFYFALSDLYLQVLQHYGTVGKNFYIDHERELAIAVGDEGAKIIKLSKDLKNEDFRAFITREEDPAMLKSSANQMLIAFKDMQLIGEDTFANLFDRATPDDVTAALRLQVGLRMEAKREAEKEAQIANQQAIQEAKNNEEREFEFKNKVQDDASDLEASRQDMDLTKTLIKEEAKSGVQQQF